MPINIEWKKSDFTLNTAFAMVIIGFFYVIEASKVFIAIHSEPNCRNANTCFCSASTENDNINMVIVFWIVQTARVWRPTAHYRIVIFSSFFRFVTFILIHISVKNCSSGRLKTTKKSFVNGSMLWLRLQLADTEIFFWKFHKVRASVLFYWHG